MIKFIKYLIIAFCFFLISCSEEIPYSVYIFNNTDYDMDELVIGFGEDRTISVTSGNVSEEIILVCPWGWRNYVVDGRMGFSFNKFSNKEDSFCNDEVSYSGISLSRLNRDSLNLIIITEDTDYHRSHYGDSSISFGCEVVHKELKNNKNKIDSKNEVIKH